MPRDAVRNEYGAAAVDYFYAPARQPSVELPEEQHVPQRKKQTTVKAKAAVAPLSVIGFAVALVMLILVVFGYVRLYEATTDHAALADQLSDLRKENAALSNQYEGQIDLAHVEEVAISELGMHKVLAEQTVYVNLSSARDKGVVMQNGGKKNFFVRAYESIADSFRALLEYLS